MKGLFFTGTDTAVGKTVIAASVAWILRQQGYAVKTSKPVATGSERIGDRCVNDDTRLLAEAEGRPDAQDEITPWTFPEPAAPPVAARLLNVTLRLGAIADAVRKRGGDDSIVIVEGVGGLLCPLTPEHTVADLIAELKLPAIVVARRSLGTLNHTLLTLEVAQRRGLSVAGLVINETTPRSTLAEETNVSELRMRTHVPLLAVVRYMEKPDPQRVAALAAVDWAALAISNP